MKKSDWIIMGVGLLIALAVYGGLQLNNLRYADLDKSLEVYIDGELIEELSLENDGTYRYESDLGYNILTVSQGQAAVTEANCSTQSCIHEGSIGDVNESVVCLPHHFHISITGAEEAEVDAISQ